MKTSQNGPRIVARTYVKVIVVDRTLLLERFPLSVRSLVHLGAHWTSSDLGGHRPGNSGGPHRRNNDKLANNNALWRRCGVDSDWQPKSARSGGGRSKRFVLRLTFFFNNVAASITTMRLTRCAFFFFAATACLAQNDTCSTPPSVSADTWLPSSIHLASTPNAEVEACCHRNPSTNLLESVRIGSIPQFSTEQALQVLSEARDAWKGGTGIWPQMTLLARIAAIRNFLEVLAESREEIVQTLMWEIGKNRKDAESEFDRTVQFANQLIDAVVSDPEFSGGNWQSIGSVRALVKRAAIGVIMCLGPYNYPLNETYATLIPALLLGNICILKIPTIGGLVHLQTIKAWSEAVPPGTIHFIGGSGRATMPPLMETGLIDGLAFIGGSNAADDLIHKHPHPHRLKVFLQLEAKNMAIFLDDIFEEEAQLESALDQIVAGTLSYNGQRCTALKLLMVSTANAEKLAMNLSGRVETMHVGLPWETSEAGVLSQVTPLPTPKRIEYMQDLLEDALKHGAKVMNKDGGKVLGGTLMVPAVVYPVTPSMRLFHEEQFGPLIPIASYESLENDVVPLARDSPYAQQVSIFGYDPVATSYLVDQFSSIHGKINLNIQAGRSPDTLPFSGRRSSAMGVMSVTDALREFSVPTVVSYKTSEANEELREGIEARSKFLEPLSAIE